MEQAKPATGGEKKPTRGNTAKTKTRSSMTALDAAVKVLGEAKGSPLSCGEMIERMLDKGYWKTDGKTPAATLYSAVLREITTKRKESRFRKVERGKFELVKGA